MYNLSTSSCYIYYSAYIHTEKSKDKEQDKWVGRYGHGRL